jgi:tetratricopeptide (TPR) repeat protein
MYKPEPHLTFRLSTTVRLSITAAALALAVPVHADVDSGAYLAARQAGGQGDYVAAATYFQNALIADANNTALMEQAITSYLGTGQGLSAAQIAQRFIDAGGTSQIANLALLANAARTENWDAIFDMLEAGNEVGPLLDGLAQAWAYIGQGKADRALQSFEKVIDTPGLRLFGQTHKALALALIGDLDGADAIYSLPPGEGIPPTRASVLTHLQVLCKMGEFDRARGILDRAFGTDADPEIAALRNAIDTGETSPFDMPVTNAAQGIAYAFKGLTNVLQGEANESYLLLYAQAARYVAPDDAEAHIAAARLLNALGQHEDASQTFAQVATSSPSFHSAEMGRAEALRRAGRFDQAIEVLNQLTRSHPELPLSHASIGDIHRQQGNFEDARASYNAALDGYGADASIRWWLLYSRGMANERLNDWPAAEADFRAALALQPDDPAVLNYLGYSMVDRGLSENYDEALEMIETAAAARPDSGAIIDSLAWVYYKLGRYTEAVAPMERAAELEPNDPVISDHLGDVYWMVGRAVEARFQWRRALSFGPEDTEAERIRRKLDIGLDAVYAQDGQTPAPAVDVANDDN